MGVILFEDGVTILPTAVDSDSHLYRNKILQACFDPDNIGLKAVDAGGPSASYGTSLDEEEIWQLVYDATNTAIRVVEVTAVGSQGSRIDEAQVIQDVFDEDLNALRISFDAPDIATVPGWKPDCRQIFRFVHLPTDHCLSVDGISVSSTTTGTRQDGEQVLQLVFNPATGKLVLVG